MKRKRTLSLLLLALIVALLTASLFACVKDDRKEREAAERRRSADAVCDSVLAAADDEWSFALTDAQAAELALPGDYIMAQGWAAMLGDVLYSSALQTAKIGKLAQTLASDDVQLLLSDFEGNADALIPLLQATQFTAEDVSGLAYGMLTSLASNSGEVLESVKNRLLKVRDMLPSGAAFQNVSDRYGDAVSALQNLVPDAASRNVMLEAFEQARAPFVALISFAYNMSVSDIAGQLLGRWSDGALQDITTGEMNAVIDAVMSGASRLADSLADEPRAALNRALKLVIDNFDPNYISSGVYSKLIEYAHYAYMLVDGAPLLDGLASSASAVLKEEGALGQLRAAMDGLQNDDEAQTKKSTLYFVLTARTLVKLSQTVSNANINAVLDGMVTFGTGDSQKALPVIFLDTLLNLTVALSDEATSEQGGIALAHPDVIGEEQIMEMFYVALYYLNIDAFKEAYKAYTDDRTSANLEKLWNLADGCHFSELGVNNPYSRYAGDNVLDEWYKFYVTSGVRAVQQKAQSLAGKAVLDIKLFVDDMYSLPDVKGAIEAIAAKPFDYDPSGDEAFFQAMRNSRLMGIVYTLMTIGANA